MLRDHKVTREQGAGCLVQNGQIIVGVGRGPGPYRQRASSQIELRLVRHQLVRRDNLRVRHEFLPHRAAEGVEVELSARRQRARQIAVAHEHCPLALECCIAENMVGMHMRIDHIADRLGGPCTDRGQQAAALAGTAAGIDHRDRVVADHKCDVGDGAFVVATHERQGSGVNEDPWRGFRHGKRFGSSLLLGNRNLLRVGRERQLCVGNELHHACGEQECRSNARQPATHARAFRGGLIPRELHQQISMVHKNREYPAGAMATS